MIRFSTIVIDPPWQVKAGRSIGAYVRQDGVQRFGVVNQASRSLSYESMPLDKIKALPVAELAHPACHLYLWVINKYMPVAYSLVKAWGFDPSTTLVWAKNPMGGGLGGAFGISTEFVIFARRGRLPSKGRVSGTWFNWKRPYTDGAPRHSSKPEEFQDMVEKVSPGPYLEMFARRKRPGWASWGNEVQSDIQLEFGTCQSN